MLNVEIVCIIQARMGSERLPGKVMKKLGDKPIVEHVINRTQKSKLINKVVLATSDQKSEENMVQFLKEKQYFVFRGDENNVLKRYVDCVDSFGGDIVVRITGDCPFIDPSVIDHVISYYLMNDYDYVRLDVPNTFVRGFDVEVFSKKAMQKVYELTANIDGASPYKEHVTYYMYKHLNEFKVGSVTGSDLFNRNYRLCVDTDSDYELAQKIYENFNNPYITGKEIIQFLDKNPMVAAINSEVNQKDE